MIRAALLAAGVTGVATAAAIAATDTPSSAQLRAVRGDPPFVAQRLALIDPPTPIGPKRLLFNGRDLRGWSAWLGYADPALTYTNPAAHPIGAVTPERAGITVATIDGTRVIRVEGRTWGGLTHEADLRNYHLRLEYRWGGRRWAPREDEPPNNGLLYHTHGPSGAVYGTWRRAVEFEIMLGSVGMVVPVGSDVRIRTRAGRDPSIIYPYRRFMVGGRSVDVTTSDPAWNVEASRDAERPQGEWNVLDLYVLGDHALHVVNGVPVMEVRDLAELEPGTRRRVPLTHGAIQLQSDGAETWFRSIVVEPIAAMPRIRIVSDAGSLTRAAP